MTMYGLLPPEILLVVGLLFIAPPVILVFLPRHAIRGLMQTSLPLNSRAPESPADVGQVWVWPLQFLGVVSALLEAGLFVNARMVVFWSMMLWLPALILFSFVYGLLLRLQSEWVASRIPSDDPHASAETVRSLGEDWLLLGGVLTAGLVFVFALIVMTS